MTTISIALCTYNGERFLDEQLESYLAQTRRPDELVVCDDRSTDATIAILERFASRAPFDVRIVVNESTLGSTRNFEHAIALCTGEQIFLSDQDDVWFPEKIARMEKEFENGNIGLVFSDAEVVDETLVPAGQRLSSLTFHGSVPDDLRNGRAFESLLNQNFVTGATAAFRSSFRNSLTPTPEGVPNLIHDGWIALSIANEAPIAFVDEPLVKYRQHGSQQIGLRIKRESDRREFFEKTISTLRGEVRRLEMLDALPQFASHDVIDKLIREKREYIEHCETRLGLSDSKTSRIAPVARELMSGRYGKYSRGVVSAMKDILESHDGESDQ